MRQVNWVIVALWVLAVVFVLMLVDWLFGGLRFAGLRAEASLSFALWLPAVCIVLLGYLPRSRARAWAFACLIPVALLCFSLGSLVFLVQSGASFKRQSSVRFGSSEIVTYFSDAGAMDSGEVVVQQEVHLLPGLLWVKPLSSRECLRDVSVTVLDRHHVRCDYVADKSDTLDPSPEAQRDYVWVF